MSQIRARAGVRRPARGRSPGVGSVGPGPRNSWPWKKNAAPSRTRPEHTEAELDAGAGSRVHASPRSEAKAKQRPGPGPGASARGGHTRGSHQHQLKLHVLPAPSALPGPGPLPRPFGHLTLYIHEQRAPLPRWTAGSTAGGTWPRPPSLGARPVSGTQHTLGKRLLTRRAGSARTHVGGHQDRPTEGRFSSRPAHSLPQRTLASGERTLPRANTKHQEAAACWRRRLRPVASPSHRGRR